MGDKRQKFYGTNVVRDKFLLATRNFPRPWLTASLTSSASFRLAQVSEKPCFSSLVHPEGFEPPTTVPKTGMISISLRVQQNNL